MTGDDASFYTMLAHGGDGGILAASHLRISRSTQARLSDIAVPDGVVTAKATASGPCCSATVRICWAVQSSASSQPIRTQPGSGSPLGRVRRRGP